MSTAWHTENQRDLVRRLSQIERRLRAAKNDADASYEVAEPEQGEVSSLDPQRDAPGGCAIDAISMTFRLSPFEREVLLLCAGVELDSAIANACAVANGASHKRYATFGIALRCLEDPHWSALSPSSALRYWHLIEVPSGENITSAALRIDESILHFLAGVHCLDPRLDALLDLHVSVGDLVPSHESLADRIAAGWKDSVQSVVQLSGSDVDASRDIAGRACAKSDASLYLLRAADVPSEPNERDRLSRLLNREFALRHGALFVDCEGTVLPQAARALLDRLGGMVFVASNEPVVLRRRPVVRVEVERPKPSEQEALWRETLGERLNGSASWLVSQFDLGARSIRSAGEAALRSAGHEELAQKAWRACCREARHGLDELAQRLQPTAGWNELVLPSLQMRALRDIASQVRCRSLVYERWGFASQGARGLGISALFAGASGTGKTMAAEVLARELQLDLFRIDLSQVVSKYIGETEKNLRRVFDAAEASGAVLLFDECDALFGKRSEVKDSHDRYANVEISYLLQRMESYRGLAILTTNMKSVLDPAFLRRLRFILQFAEPDSQLRAEIWRRAFPPQTPRRDIDIAKLARLNVTGGNIRNIAMHAAFVAADADEPVCMTHLLRAARCEYSKLDRQLSEAECRDWV
jgi:hypothetical protein